MVYIMDACTTLKSRHTQVYAAFLGNFQICLLVLIRYEKRKLASLLVAIKMVFA